MLSTYFSLLLVLTPVITGRVTDPTGQPIPGATVRIQMESGGATETLTDSKGAFRVEVSGRFHLEIRHDGFRSIRSSTVSLSSGAEDVYETGAIQLLPGNSGDVENVVLQFDEVAASEFRGGSAIREGLPKSDRLFGLRGGVNVTGIAVGSGQQWLNSSGNVFTSSSMASSMVNTADFSAELGDTNLSNDSLPSGEADFHGNLYYFHRNDAFNAKNYFDPANAPIPPFKYHFFGANTGGMFRGKTYFYSEYSGLRIDQSITRAATVPNPALLTGDFSSIPEQLIDPDSGFPFPGNRIPSNRFSPLGAALARLYPAPNVDNPNEAQNYRASGKLATAADNFGFRLDRRWSTSNEAFIEYQVNRDTTDDPFNLLSGITNLPGFGVHDAVQTHTLRVNNAHVFSPTLIHQVRFSYGYLKQPRTTLDGTDAALPAILMSNYSHLGHAPNLPQQRRNRSFELMSDLSWQRGESVWKFGGVTRYLPFQASMDLYSRGQYQFTGGVYTGDALANLLLGLPANALRLTGDTTRDFRTWTSSVYAQREWRPRPNLSVNAGVRYDYQTPFSEARRRAVNFDAAAGRLSDPSKTLYERDRNNFGPRIGLAWQPFGDMVARAGYGIFYDTLSVGDSLFLLGLNPPFVDFDVRNNNPVLPQFDLATAFNGSLPSVQPSIFSTPRQLSNPYVQQWNASIEHPAGRLFVASISYFGQKGTRLRRQLNFNQPPAGPAGSLDERRPYADFKNIFQFETSASSIAHAGELRIERRFRSGVGVAAAYRFSRSIDDATLISILPQDSHNLAAERGLSDFHVKHRLAFSANYSLPGLRFAALRGWQLQAIGTMQSGMPLSAVIGKDVSGTGSPIVNRPHLIRNPNISNVSPSRFFDTGAFVIPEAGAFGNSGRNVIIGPGIQNIDLALARNVRVTDVLRVQIRADFYNALNHPNFVAPPSMQNFADAPEIFGALFVSRSPRIMQLGLKFLW